MEGFLIQLTDTIRLRKSDKMNFIIETLEKQKDRKTQEIKFVWQIQGYYGDLESLFKGAISFAIENELKDITDLKKCYDAIMQVEDNIMEIMNKQFSTLR